MNIINDCVGENTTIEKFMKTDCLRFSMRFRNIHSGSILTFMLPVWFFENTDVFLISCTINVLIMCTKLLNTYDEQTEYAIKIRKCKILSGDFFLFWY